VIPKHKAQESVENLRGKRSGKKKERSGNELKMSRLIAEGERKKKRRRGKERIKNRFKRSLRRKSLGVWTREIDFKEAF